MHRSQPPKCRWAIEILMAMAVLSCSSRRNDKSHFTLQKGTINQDQGQYLCFSLSTSVNYYQSNDLDIPISYADTCHHFKNIHTHTHIYMNWHFDLECSVLFNANILLKHILEAFIQPTRFVCIITHILFKHFEGLLSSLFRHFHFLT